MRRVTWPALTVLLFLAGGCSHNREYDGRPSPDAGRTYRVDEIRRDGEWGSPAGRALAMRDELRLTDRQMARLERIRRSYERRDRPRGNSEGHRNDRKNDRAERNFNAERREVDAVLTEDQRDRYYRR